MSTFGNYGYNDEEGVLSLSLPYDMGYPDVERKEGFLSLESNENKQRIIMCGQKWSGKTSILKVVFHKMSANETLFLGQTSKVTCDDINNSIFVQFQIWDVPGDANSADRTIDSVCSLLKGNSCLIYVIDARDDYQDSLVKLHATVTRAYEVNPETKFNVFIHKVDGLSDEQKLDVNRNIHQQTMEELTNSKLEGIYINFFVTSIYDHSIFEAFSKVIQKLNPQQAVLENLLDIMIGNCDMEKVFLIDVVSKIYITTDSSPFDSQTYELCGDMIDVVIDVSCIYGVKDENEVMAGDTETQSVIKLSNSTVLYLREVNKYLALVCLLKGDVFQKQGLIDYNFLCLKKAILEVYEVGKKLNNREI